MLKFGSQMMSITQFENNLLQTLEFIIDTRMLMKQTIFVYHSVTKSLKKSCLGVISCKAYHYEAALKLGFVLKRSCQSDFEVNKLFAAVW